MEGEREDRRDKKDEQGKAVSAQTRVGGGCLLADDEAAQYSTCVTVSQQQLLLS